MERLELAWIYRDPPDLGLVNTMFPWAG
ncbi:hypothetical protein MNBD_ALPHA04-550, partial [hydrothermal vent metagenome]